MATSSIGFRWLDIIEKDFDKACVELDTTMGELEAEEPEVVFTARQKIATLSSCFAQLTHKALTVFQHSAKLEAELVDMRAELVQARACLAAGSGEGSVAGSTLEAARAKAEASQLARENASLRETVLALHSELFGARLATKYLDKELAGRIQQLQLLGRDMRADIRDSLWAQVEAEILLQRHKTLVRVCRGVPGKQPQPVPPPPPQPRTVRVQRSPHLGLGISVTGGREHGVPILISELELGGPAQLTGELFVGDAILAINDLDLTQACHKDAVAALQSVKGDCALCVQYIATEEDERLSEDNYSKRYRFLLYPEEAAHEMDGAGATPTAPRTPDYNDRPPSVSDIINECEPTRYPEPYKPTYPDYTTNNMAILDMDDESIKIETQVEALKIDSPPISPVTNRARQRQRGAYIGIPADFTSDSNHSPDSTPVHGPRYALKKKRIRPSDWKIKGAYKPIDDDVHSSDEPPVPNGKVTPETPIETNPPVRELIKLDDPKLQPLPPPQEIPRKKSLPSKPNGLDPKLMKNKGFRIGSAKRVSDTPPVLNGTANGEKFKYPVQLVAGDGDPDFGTPV